MSTRDLSTLAALIPSSPPTPAPRGVARLVRDASRVASRWPKTVVMVWVVLIAACVFAGATTGTRSITDADSLIGESGRADARIAQTRLGAPPSEVVMVRTDSPARTDAIAADLTRRLQALPEVARIASPLPEDGAVAGLRTADGRAVLLDVTLTGSTEDASDHALPLTRTVDATRRANPGTTIEQTGTGSIDAAIDTMVEQDLRKAELVSVPLTLVVLVLAFGSFVAASVPLVLGITAVAGAMGALGVISQVVPSGDATGALVVLIGLAVGVDYSLFYVRREREERRRGRGPASALEAAAASVGRAILVSGTTVVIALAGLLLTGVAEFTSMAVGTIVVVAVAVLGSLTVLPAMLTLLGDRIEAGRPGLPGAKRRRARRAAARTSGSGISGSRISGSRISGPRISGPGRRWARVAGLVTGHPVVALGGSLLLLLTLALPATGMRLGEADGTSLPAGIPAVRAAAAIEAAFPGGPQTAELLVTGSGLDTSGARTALAAMGDHAREIAGGTGETPVRTSGDGRTAVIEVPVPDRGADGDQHTVELLRSALSPAEVPGATAVLITGEAAGDLDFSHAVTHASWLVAAFVLGLALLVLLLAFRSLPLALAVIGFNVLSVGAAFGVMVLVFQGTWAEGLLDFTSSGTITTWLPLVSFVILFGLSMDYSVLLLERIREAHEQGRSPREAAAEGLTATAGTVTAAAVVMVAVFAVFATLRLLSMKQIGVGLASAVLVDATVVRAIALPAAVTLLGRRAFPTAATPAPGGPVCDDDAMSTVDARPRLGASHAGG